MEMRSALIVGVGSGLSASLARLFARNGCRWRWRRATPTGLPAWRARPPPHVRL